MTRTLVFCLDACTYPLVLDIMNENVFFNLASQKRFGPLEVPVPASTSTGFPSFFTGKNLGKLGAFTTKLDENSVQHAFYGALEDIKGDCLWDILDKEDMKTIAFNIPCTYPAKSINGVMISSFDSLGNNWTYPLELRKELSQVWNPKEEMAKEIEATEFVKYFLRRLDIETDIAKKLIREHEWDLALIGFLQLDRFSHQFMSYTDLHRNLFMYIIYHKVGKTCLALMNEAARQNEPFEVVVMSDHGMSINYRHLVINSYLQKRKYLTLPPNIELFVTAYDSVVKSSTIDFNTTKLWSSGQGLIAVNDERFTGVVKEDEREDLLNQITEELTTLVDLFSPDRATHPVLEIRRKEEEWKGGKYLRQMPDLIVLPIKGYALHTPNMVNSILKDTEPFSSTYHYHDNGFYMTTARDPGLAPAHLFELSSTILEALDIKIPKDFDRPPLPKKV